MNKGINTIVEETKNEFVTLINSKLDVLPISVIGLIVEGIAVELRNGIDNAIKQEAKQYAEQQKAESEQVEWVGENDLTPIGKE